MNLICWLVFMLGVTLAAPPDFYQVLNVDYNATDAEIRAAYKKLTQKNHPDKSTGSEEKFKPIRSAWDTLSNPVKKNEYDKKISAFKKRRGKTSNQGAVINKNNDTRKGTTIRKPIIVKPIAAAPFKKQTVKPLDPRLYRAEDVKVWGANTLNAENKSPNSSTSTERKVKFPEFESNKQKPVYPVGRNSEVLFPKFNNGKAPAIVKDSNPSVTRQEQSARQSTAESAINKSIVKTEPQTEYRSVTGVLVEEKPRPDPTKRYKQVAAMGETCINAADIERILNEANRNQ